MYKYAAIDNNKFVNHKLRHGAGRFHNLWHSNEILLKTQLLGSCGQGTLQIYSPNWLELAKTCDQDW